MMPEIPGNTYHEQLSEILDASDKLMLDALTDVHDYHEKGDRDYALEVDLDVEKAIKSALAAIDPDIPVLGEEFDWSSGSQEQPGVFWVVDPIDGTVNYARQLPLYGTSVALIQGDIPILAGISFPALGERYTAGLGTGAYLNGKRISISGTQKLSDAVVTYGDFAVGNNAQTRNKFRFDFMEYFASRALRVRIPGTAALQLAWVACGRADISITPSNSAWDVQGGVLIVREAGGEVYDFNGSQHTTASRYTLASSAALKPSVLAYFENN
ncbi:MAG: inositol monophosphatase family protein [Anaerolineales bacterium]|nr:inositol monophosphatase family protein [Anaerolineales bacterium]